MSLLGTFAAALMGTACALLAFCAMGFVSFWWIKKMIETHNGAEEG